MIKLSVAMIVKNEESCLATALNSIRKADEIIVVDTGSKDGTIDIAKRYTDKVYSGKEYLWRDDFSFSRNQSIEKCSGDWILIIDADEFVDPDFIIKARDEISKLTDEDALLIKVTAKSNRNKYHYSIRLFKNTGEIKYMGRAHNYLTGYKKAKKVDLTLIYGYSNAHTLDPDRTLRILTKAIKDNPDLKRERFYLAREYFYRQNWDEAIRHYLEYIAGSKKPYEKSDACIMIARCYNSINDTERAKEFVLRAISINKEFKEAYRFMSELDPDNRSEWLEKERLSTNENVLFIRC